MLELLGELELVEPPEESQVHPRLVFRAPRGMSTVADAIALLHGARIDVVDIGLRLPSLDKVFLQLTEVTT